MYVYEIFDGADEMFYGELLKSSSRHTKVV